MPSKQKVMQEANIQEAFLSAFIDRVFPKWESPLETQPKNKVTESILWRYSLTDKRTTVSVDIARQKPCSNILFLFELKCNIGLSFSQCGYILLGSQLYRDTYDAIVHPYMVCRINNNRKKKEVAFDEVFNIYLTRNNNSGRDAIVPFQKATGLGLVLLEMSEQYEIVKIHIKEINSTQPLIQLAKESSAASLLCKNCIV
jgi:hypothetical protein